MRKDVLIMCQYFFPEYVSSATLPTQLAEDLVQKGLIVDVLCGYPNEFYDGAKVARTENYKGINIRRVKYTQLNNKSKLGRIINFFSFFIAVLFNTHRLIGYKCILVYSNPPILPLIPYLISRLSKVKFIFIAFDLYPESALALGAVKKGGLIERLMNFINNKVYRYASGIVAIGTEMKQYMLKRDTAINPDLIRVIPNWYSENKLKGNVNINNKEFKELRMKWPFIVLYSGNMGNCQDMDTILKCIYRFKNSDKVLFLFTGHGTKVEYVKKYVENNRISNAKIYGFLLGEDYADALRISDICLVSLAQGIEGLGVPSKTYGYLAAGKPVLAIMSKDTDIAKNLFEYNAGATVLQGDVDGLEKLIIEFMDNKEQTQLYGKNARKVFKTFYERQICTNMYYRMILDLIYDKKN
jgi:glycosyltransferase involved in cell wall biosynthesis